MAHILDLLEDRVVLGDGANGTTIQDMNLDVEKDFHGHENLFNYLVRSNPDALREVHRSFLGAGAEMLKSPTFGSTPSVLDEFGLADQAFGLNKEAIELLREVIEEFKGDGRDRFVVGPVGPGTKLPSLGHIDYDTLEEDYTCQCAGLIAGGVDVISIMTCQDPLQIKAALNGAKRACGDAGTDTTVQVMVTMETTGTMLVGTEMAAVAAVIEPYDVPLVGLNCATGPVEMQQHVAWLGDHWPSKVGIWPNAGLPELVKGKTHYPLLPQELSDWQERFIEENGINLVGGCCGTDATHIQALDEMLRRRAGKGERRPIPARRTHHWMPAVASLYSHVPLSEKAAPLRIDDACARTDNETFRSAVEAEDWDGCIALARAREKAGGQIAAVCFSGFDRDEVADMEAFISRLRGSVSAPLLVEADDPAALTAALKLYGGKATVGGVDFAAGDGAAAARLVLARRFGAAVMGHAIDEDGPAHDVEGALRISRRLNAVACEEHGLSPADLLIEVPALPLASAAGRLTLDAIEAVAAEFPECRVVVSLSALSAGLDAAAAEVLQSVFLDHACRRGLGAAICNVARIIPADDIDTEERRAAEELIFDERSSGADPLPAFLDLIAARPPAPAAAEGVVSVDERLKQRIIEGERAGIEDDLDEALKSRQAIDIINEVLLAGMKVVGDLFGDGKMPLPFVLESAETMNAAVACLEPFLDKVEGQTRGTIVLATVKGDIHDIGKNLADIILTNNGYRTVNIGAKQPIENIIAAVREHEADALGLSGLLIRSAVIMRENLEELTRQGLDLPVFLGGASLNRKYVEEDCMSAYGGGRVAYAGDVFDGLNLMEKVVDGDFDELVAEASSRRGAAKEKATKKPPPTPLRPMEVEEIRLMRSELETASTVPTPPFWGPRMIDKIAPKAVLPYLNESMLFRFHWGYKAQGRGRAAWQEWVDAEARPILRDLIDTCDADASMVPQAVYGYWPCAADGDTLVLFAEDGATEVARFSFPRQQRPGGLCIADFFRTFESNQRDVVALQAVTVGEAAAAVARRCFAEDRYRDYVNRHGFNVEMTEALAEYVHKRIRAELGFGHEDARERQALLKQGYRGVRYSFGYSACPDLADQRPLLDLLDARRIGIVMADEHQLHPEESTTAIVIHHPQAKYFNV